MCIRVNISGEMINAILTKYFYLKRHKSPRVGTKNIHAKFGECNKRKQLTEIFWANSDSSATDAHHYRENNASDL